MLDSFADEGTRTGSNGDAGNIVENGGAENHRASTSDMNAAQLTGSPVFACPGCAHNFTVSIIPENGLLTCPACSAEFFAVTELCEEDRHETQRLELEQQIREERIVSLRENKVLLERRSTMRFRSYAILGVVVCGMAAMQLAWYGARRVVFSGFDWVICLFAAAIIGCFYLAWKCTKKVRELTDELNTPAQSDPTTPPDFSTLSDGSQTTQIAARNLEQMLE